MAFRKVTLGLRCLRSREWGFAISSGGEPFWFWSLKLAQVGTFFTFFRICSAFFGFPHSSWLFPSICFHFSRFFCDLGQVSGRFFDDVCYFFRNMPKRVEVNKTLRGRMNFKGRLWQKQTNSATKQQKNDEHLTPEKNKCKNCSEIWFGRVLGSIWEGFGTLWAVLEPLLGAFLVFAESF